MGNEPPHDHREPWLIGLADQFRALTANVHAELDDYTKQAAAHANAITTLAAARDRLATNLMHLIRLHRDGLISNDELWKVVPDDEGSR